MPAAARSAQTLGVTGSHRSRSQRHASIAARCQQASRFVQALVAIRIAAMRERLSASCRFDRCRARARAVSSGFSPEHYEAASSSGAEHVGLVVTPARRSSICCSIT